jgi:hypothetical protein
MHLFEGCPRTLTRPFADSLVVLAVLVTALGCNLSPGPGGQDPARSAQALVVTNGLSNNGLSNNGLSNNGLSNNGLSNNGLSNNGVFGPWLRQDPTLRAQLMKYLVACAVPAGGVRTYTDPITGTIYTWTGQLGLAPDWASGLPATVAEEQIVSACLAAHANPFEAHVPFSIQGRDARGIDISFTSQELADFSVPEACFFGNLFRAEGLYSGSDRTKLHPSESTTRVCGLTRDNNGQNPGCLEILRVGKCNQNKNCSLDPTGRYYTQCTRQGVTYLPLTTRLQPSEIHVCGDGICQLGEGCGNSQNADRCVDCPCP